MRRESVSILVLAIMTLSSVSITGCITDRCVNHECGCHDVVGVDFGGHLVLSLYGEDLNRKSSITNAEMRVELRAGTLRQVGHLAILGDWPANATAPPHIEYKYIFDGPTDSAGEIKIEPNKPLKLFVGLTILYPSDNYLTARSFFNESKNITGTFGITNSTSSINLTLDRHIDGVTTKNIAKTGPRGEVDLIVKTKEWDFTVQLYTSELCVD